MALLAESAMHGGPDQAKFTLLVRRALHLVLPAPYRHGSVDREATIHPSTDPATAKLSLHHQLHLRRSPTLCLRHIRKAHDSGRAFYSKVS